MDKAQIIDSVSIDMLSPNCKCSASSSSKFWLTSDDKFLIFDAPKINEFMEGVLPYPSSIFAYNIHGKKIIQLSPNGVHANDIWLSSKDEIYYTGTTDCVKQNSCIYKTNLKDFKSELIIENARKFSCRKSFNMINDDDKNK